MLRPTIRPDRRAFFALAMFATIATQVPVSAAEGVSLFKIVTPRDEMFIGLTAEELARLGPGTAVETLAKKIAADGQMTLWQYAVKCGADGKMVFGPSAKVAVFAAGVVRIEPYKPAYEVIAPAP